MKTLFCVLGILGMFTSSAQKFKGISPEEVNHFYDLQSSFRYTVDIAEKNNCCFEDSLISKNYRLYYKQMSMFLMLCNPGKNLDSLETDQIISLVERIDFMINSSIETGFPISTAIYMRRVGYTPYEHWFFLNEMNTIMVKKPVIQKAIIQKTKMSKK